MKRNIVLYLVILLFSFSCSEESSNYDITGVWESQEFLSLLKIDQSGSNLTLDFCGVAGKMAVEMIDNNLFVGSKKIGRIINNNSIEVVNIEGGRLQFIKVNTGAYQPGSVSVTSQNYSVSINSNFCAKNSIIYVTSGQSTVEHGAIKIDVPYQAGKLILNVHMLNFQSGIFVLPNQQKDIGIDVDVDADGDGQLDYIVFIQDGTLQIDQFTGDHVKGIFNLNDNAIEGSFDVDLQFRPQANPILDSM